MDFEDLERIFGKNKAATADLWLGLNRPYSPLIRWSLPTRAKRRKSHFLLTAKTNEAFMNFEASKNSPKEACCRGIYYGIYASWAAACDSYKYTLEEIYFLLDTMQKEKNFDFPLIHMFGKVASYKMPYDKNELNEECWEGYLKGLSEGKAILWCCWKKMSFIEFLFNCIITIFYTHD